VNLNI